MPAGEVADPGGVATLDGDDLCRSGKRLLREVRRLAVVGGDAGVLEEHGGVQEPLPVLRRRSELERRPLAGSATESLFEERDVVALVAADDLRELQQFAAKGAGFDGRRVEGGLEVLEEKREVEDPLVERL
jgi:hypothetical protein